MLPLCVGAFVAYRLFLRLPFILTLDKPQTDTFTFYLNPFEIMV